MDAVCEAIGAAESYKVSVSCVGSDWSLHVRESVPAPQSQKNLRHKHSIKSTVKKLKQSYKDGCMGKVTRLQNDYDHVRRNLLFQQIDSYQLLAIHSLCSRW